MDLAEGHVAALQYMGETSKGYKAYSVFNLGTGNGYSVLQMIEAMRTARYDFQHSILVSCIYRCILNYY